MTASTPDRPTSRRVDKQLFESGSQCAKRLVLDYRGEPVSTTTDPVLTELGERVLILARQAFPGGVIVEEEDPSRAAETTRDLIESGQAPIIFGGWFQTDEVEVQADIVIVMPGNKLDLFEVKAGTTVKPRHLIDVALQIHTIEQAGFEVGSASVLHLDPRYRHRGGDSYPVQRLFKRVDVTTRSRKHLERVAARIPKILNSLEDEEALELPMGTWCHHPLRCPRIPECERTTFENPLINLPELAHSQEQQLHEQGIETIDQIDPAAPGLTLAQRRAVRAQRSGKIESEPFVTEEIESSKSPLCFLHVLWHMEMLPSFANQRPWQQLPIAWSILRVERDGTEEFDSFAISRAEDPRRPCLENLANALVGAGRVIVYQPEFHKRLHRSLDADRQLKPHVRSILSAPILNLSQVVRRGVYHKDFAGSFELPAVFRALMEKSLPLPKDIRTADDVTQTYRKMMRSRTHASTRQKLADSLIAYCENYAEAIAEIFRKLK